MVPTIAGQAAIAVRIPRTIICQVRGPKAVANGRCYENRYMLLSGAAKKEDIFRRPFAPQIAVCSVCLVPPPLLPVDDGCARFTISSLEM